jgi:hypothetical protein
VRVANILSYAVLKILAFQDRHENKDSYDPVYCLLNYGDGPEDAGRAAHTSAIRDEPKCRMRLSCWRSATSQRSGHVLRGRAARPPAVTPGRPEAGPCLRWQRKSSQLKETTEGQELIGGDSS